MAGKRRRTRQKEWRPPLIPFNKLPVCHCGVEMGMRRMRGSTLLCCLVCACNWIPEPKKKAKRERDTAQVAETRVRSLRERLRDN